MLRNLLTPLKSAFDEVRSPGHSRQPSAVLPTSPEEDRPEDFAHDVRVEILRRTIDELRHAVDVAVQNEVRRVCLTWGVHLAV